MEPVNIFRIPVWHQILIPPTDHPDPHKIRHISPQITFLTSWRGMEQMRFGQVTQSLEVKLWYRKWRHGRIRRPLICYWNRDIYKKAVESWCVRRTWSWERGYPVYVGWSVMWRPGVQVYLILLIIMSPSWGTCLCRYILMFTFTQIDCFGTL